MVQEDIRSVAQKVKQTLLFLADLRGLPHQENLRSDFDLIVGLDREAGPILLVRNGG
jgi:hypothetical protein